MFHRTLDFQFPIFKVGSEERGSAEGGRQKVDNSLRRYFEFSTPRFLGQKCGGWKCGSWKAKCGKDWSSAQMIILVTEWVCQGRNDYYSVFKA